MYQTPLAYDATPGIPLGAVAPGRFLEVKGFLSTGTASASPLLRSVTVAYSPL